jgi:hypothetical protein
MGYKNNGTICMTCKWAEWRLTPKGRLAVKGDGVCGYPYTQLLRLPAAYRLISRIAIAGGPISRTDNDPVMTCPRHELMEIDKVRFPEHSPQYRMIRKVLRENE